MITSGKFVTQKGPNTRLYQTLSKLSKNPETNWFGFPALTYFILLVLVLYFGYHFTGLTLNFIKVCIRILSSKFIFVSEWNMNVLNITEAIFLNYFFLNVFSLRNITVSDQSKTQSAETERFMNFFPDMGEQVFRGVKHSWLLWKWSTGATKEQFALLQYRQTWMTSIRDQSWS